MATKSNDLLGAALAFAAVVGLGVLYLRKQAAEGRGGLGRSGPFDREPVNAGGPYGGSWFAPEVQREWAVPDQQLPGWADL